MERKDSFRVAIGLIGAILLGSVSNGVWEYVLQPMLTWTRDIVLNIASLGIAKFKDTTYQEIAQGFTEGAGRQVHFLMLMLYMVGLISIPFIFNDHIKSLQQRWQRSLDRIKEIREGKEEKAQSIEDWQQELDALAPQFVRVRRLNYAVLAVVFLAGNAIAYARNSYITSAVAHYNQVLRIAAPYMSSSEEEESAAAFARIGSRTDYETVLKKLENIVSAHGTQTPRFNPW